MSKEQIAEFINPLTCGPGGKHAYYRPIRAFYNWAYDEGHITELPRMNPPKVPEPVRYAVKLEDLPKLLDPAVAVRHKPIVSMLADTSLRRAELCSVGWADIDQDGDTISFKRSN